VEKSLREQRNEGAQRIFSFVDLLSPPCVSNPSRRGTARGGNCIKVDVGYARAAPSVRGIINSQRRAVTKVRACSLVSRSVSGQADSSSLSSFHHLHHFIFFFFSLASLSLENPRIDPGAIIYDPSPHPCRLPRTCSYFISGNVRVKFLNTIFLLFCFFRIKGNV